MPAESCPAPVQPAASWNYWSESHRPLTSLAFVTPLLAGYELGVLWLGPQAVRNGADVWLRRALEILGFGQHFLLPGLTVTMLLAWHYTTRQPWHLSGRTLYGMAVECFVLAFGLRLVLHLEGGLLESLTGPLAAAGPAAALSPGLRPAVGYLGAGVYEELLFRLMLLPAAFWVLRNADVPLWSSVILAVLLTSLAFAAAHYVGPYGEVCELRSAAFWFGFTFRFVAGTLFATLFVCRGFGIAAGTHAGYNILVGLV